MFGIGDGFPKHLKDKTKLPFLWLTQEEKELYQDFLSFFVQEIGKIFCNQAVDQDGVISISLPENEKNQRSWLEKIAAPYHLYSENAHARWQHLEVKGKKYLFASSNRDFAHFVAVDAIFWPNAVLPTEDKRLFALGNILLPAFDSSTLQARPLRDNCSLCQRFQEFYQKNYWVGMVYGMEAGEEKALYPLLYQLARQRQGILLLAPRDPEQYEPIYRELLSYRLPITRDNRLMTSFVPKNSRIYYIEDQAIADNFLSCVDFIIFGGCFKQKLSTANALLPLLTAAPLFASTACQNPWFAAAESSGWLTTANDNNDLAAAIIKTWQQPLASMESRIAWLNWQAGSRRRLIEFLRQNHAKN
jgi:3-deoxy-D-manno-octulosonic-acid transferase